MNATAEKVLSDEARDLSNKLFRAIVVAHNACRELGEQVSSIESLHRQLLEIYEARNA